MLEGQSRGAVHHDQSKRHMSAEPCDIESSSSSSRPLSSRSSSIRTLFIRQYHSSFESEPKRPTLAVLLAPSSTQTSLWSASAFGFVQHCKQPCEQGDFPQTLHDPSAIPAPQIRRFSRGSLGNRRWFAEPILEQEQVPVQLSFRI